MLAQRVDIRVAQVVRLERELPGERERRPLGWGEFVPVPVQGGNLVFL
jgi:hypothetical protein